MNFQEALRNIGFTQQEALIYTTLCKHGALTGYEAAKLSGISRSNAYAALYSLQEKGKCHVIEGDVIKYCPISKDELLFNVQRELQQTLHYIDNHFPTIAEISEPYITIYGEKNVMNKIKNTLLLCQYRVYISGHSEQLQLFSNELNELALAGKKVVVICKQPLHIEGSIFYPRHKEGSGIKLIVDTSIVITGQLSPSEKAQCLYSENKTLVQLMRESFITEIDFITITNNNN